MKYSHLLTGALIALAVAAPLILSGVADPAPADEPQATSLLDQLREGGYVLACRHAITDRSRGDARSVDLADRSTQRILSGEGEAQARRWGMELEELGIPVGPVVAGEYFRNSDTAELAFGRVERDPGLNYGRSAEQRARRRQLFSTPPPRATNRVLVTHQGILYRMMPQVERGSIGEGDCVIVEPLGEDRFEVLRRVEPGAWGALG